MHRVQAYIDGFNLYHGLRAQHGRRLHWLDVQRLVQKLLKADQQLEQVTYFTARIRNDPDAEARQSDYLDALNAHCGKLVIVDGRYQAKRRSCRACGSTWTVYEEKETDVNIAVSLVADAAVDQFDTALLISADSDLCPALRAVRRLDGTKRIIAAFPPRRHSSEVHKHADVAFPIGAAKLRQAQLPRVVTTPEGVALSRPKYWE